MADNAIAGYADALFAVAAANDVLATVEDELFRFSQALSSDENLRQLWMIHPYQFIAGSRSSKTF